MADFLLLMHSDYDQDQPENWQSYLDMLSAAGALRGGSEIGQGLCVRKFGSAADLSNQLIGYVKIEARDLDHAKELVVGNPVFEAGGAGSPRPRGNRSAVGQPSTRNSRPRHCLRWPPESQPAASPAATGCTIPRSRG